MAIVVHQDCKITKAIRQKQYGHRSCVIWLTGYSGAGKSSVASELERRLVEEFDAKTYLLDGDNIRLGLSQDLGFSEQDRAENIRRVGEVAKLFVDSGLIAISAFISPFKNDRDLARNMVEEREFIEVFVDTPLDVCEQRDKKGLYKKARAGEITDFTGIDSPYEPPTSPEVHLKNSEQSIGASVEQIIQYLNLNNYI